MEHCLISIIVPVYNVAEYLDKCLTSILRQTYGNIEIIVVDDGSTDGSGEICDRYAEECGVLQVVHKENGGAVSAREAGLEKAGGKYIGFVDGDDYVEEDMFRRLAETMEETGADFVHSGYWAGHRKWSCMENAVIHLQNAHARENFIKERVLNFGDGRCISPSLWSKLFRAELIKKSHQCVPGTQEAGEDFICLAECILRSGKVSFLNMAGYHYTLREGSLSRQQDAKALMWQTGWYKAMEGILKRHGCWEQLKESLDHYLIGAIWGALIRVVENPLLIRRYLMKESVIEAMAGRKVILYGAGAVGRDYYSQLRLYEKCQIVAWMDSAYQKINYEYADVVGREALRELEYDFIVIAVRHQEDADSIRQTLLEEEVDSSRILWEEPLDACGRFKIRRMG